MRDINDESDQVQLLKRWESLRTERSSWFIHWKEISDYLLPRSGRFFITDRNRGGKRHNQIYDNTGTRALRVLAAGMMAGMTSPARPWFRLTTADPDLAKFQPVKHWLNQVTTGMQGVFARSNTYRSLHMMYEELGAFGTGASIIMPNFDRTIHHYPLTTGEYCIATDYDGNVNTLFREFERTVAEVVAEFGYENCSGHVQSLFDNHSLESAVWLIHAIEPRRDRDPRMRDNRNMPWRSVYFEKGEGRTKLLRDSGFKYFRAVVPRWAATGGDVYGNSPGMEALGDIRQLQHQQLRKAQSIDYQTKPPLQLPTSMKNREVDTLPGGLTYVDATAANAGVRTAFETRLDLNHLLADMMDVRERIRGAFYADLFLMLSSQPISNMTATEVAERHEEKLLMLGPVLERMHNELLDPLIELTFEEMLATNQVPPPPEEMQGVELKVEFVSMLAQAQRAVGVNSIDRYVNSIGAVAQIKPDVLDKFDSDVWAEKYADMLGVDPELVVPGEQAAVVRKARADQMAQQQQSEQAAQEAATMRDMAAAKTGGEENALTNVIEMFSGYNTP